MTAQRIEMPYAVKVYQPQSASSNGWTWRYFKTKAEAIAFSGDVHVVTYRPGKAWCKP